MLLNPYPAIYKIPAHPYLGNYTNAGTRGWFSIITEPAITESARWRQNVDALLDSFVKRNSFESWFCWVIYGHLWIDVG